MNQPDIKRDVTQLVPTPAHPYRRLAKRTWMKIPGTSTYILVAQIITRTAP